jgi:two-component system, NarL family, sensor kinase
MMATMDSSEVHPAAAGGHPIGAEGQEGSGVAPSTPALTILASTGTALVIVAFGWMLARGRPLEAFYGWWMFHNGPPAVLVLWLGRLILRRRPRHGAGRVLLISGTAAAIHVIVAATADAGFVAAGVVLGPGVWFRPADLPLAVSIPLWVTSWLWLIIAVPLMVWLPAIFPDGKLPGPRWRWLPVTAVFGTVLLAGAHSIVTWPTRRIPITQDEFPLDHDAVTATVAGVGGVLVLVSALGAIVALVVRWWRTAPEQRGQFRAVGTAAILLAVIGTITWPWQQIWAPATLVLILILLATYALAAARYRVHDLDPFLGRAAVATILAAGITGAYVAIVVGIGALIGGRGESTLLPLVAVAVVAILVEPARRHARRLVDRLLYGQHTDRDQLLSRLAERTARPGTGQEALIDVADLLLHSTGADRAEVWVDREGELTLGAASGADHLDMPVLHEAVIHHGDRLGEIRLHTEVAGDLIRDADRVVADVARLLGVVLRNQHLTEELRTQLTELRRSRQRLVTIHDQARRELERDIHDGAQSQLIALKARLGLARTLADPDDRALAAELDVMAGEIDTAVRSLRRLARGLHPPILEESGLVAALRSHAREVPATIRLHAEDLGRFDRAIEGAVYFTCLEAIHNALRHGKASVIDLHLDADADRLRFAVTDDGGGFDPARRNGGTGLTNIHDRLSALDGSVDVVAEVGRGITLQGWLPVRRTAGLGEEAAGV